MYSPNLGIHLKSMLGHFCLALLSSAARSMLKTKPAGQVRIPGPKVETRHRTSASVPGVAVQPCDEPLITVMTSVKVSVIRKERILAGRQGISELHLVLMLTCHRSKPPCLRPLSRPDSTILTCAAFNRKFDSRIGDASADSRFLILTRYRFSAYHTQYTRGTSNFAGGQTSAYGAGEL